MDDLAQDALYDAISGLGNWHTIEEGGKEVEVYLATAQECVSCLQDLLVALKHDPAEAGAVAWPKRLKLGQWRTLSNHLVPLFTSYRGDARISSLTLKVIAQLTAHPPANVAIEDSLRHLEYLQDYKEAFARNDVLVVLMTMLLQNMDEDDPEAMDDAADKPRADKEVFEDALATMRNLVTLPDPVMGDAGFSPLRKNLQLDYIRHFHNEGALDFFLLFGETLSAEQNVDHAWALADILYHVCTHVNPEELVQKQMGRDKKVLSDLLGREKADARLRMPRSTRHGRFGTAMVARDGHGGISLSASVQETYSVSRGAKLSSREFKDPSARSGSKKQNMFHDPFFTDLEEGSVRDHNQLNPHLRSGLDVAKNIPGPVLAGLHKFFDEFVQTTFTGLVQLLRSSLVSRPSERTVTDNHGRPLMLNFVSWVLEFHRHSHKVEVAKAKASRKDPPLIDIAVIQGAIDLDLLQFVTARLREYGKGSNFHPSHLVVALRTLHQQVKTVGVVLDSKDEDIRSCGEILTQNYVKEDLMAHLGWIFKNFKSSQHDPRILSYTVEVFHFMLQHMGKVVEAKAGGRGEKLEFQVERIRGLHTQRPTTTVEKEIASLADARVVENLFYMLEKYKRHSPQLNSMLVKLIYQIIKAERTNIVVFFELSYFLRIHRICSDPWVIDRGGQLSVKDRYREMVSLLQHILRQFFKCAEVNSCAFVELLFRKIPDSSKEALLGDHRHEFAAILDDYEEEEYKKIMERMEAGETVNAMRERQRAMLASHGEAPWTEEEDAMLRERYAVYADHSLFAELLVAELPEDSDRTARQVKKRLADLGLLRRAARGQVPEQEAAPPAVPEDLDGDLDGPPAKKQKTMEERQTWTPNADAQPADGAPGGAPADEDLELDLERLLDAAMDEGPGAGAAGMDVEPGGEGSLEAELAAMLEDPPEAPPAAAAAAASAAAPAPAQEPDSLQAELAALFESQPAGPPAGEPQAPPAAAAPAAAPAEDSLQAELEALLESQPAGPPAGPPAGGEREAPPDAAAPAPAPAPPAAAPPAAAAPCAPAQGLEAPLAAAAAAPAPPAAATQASEGGLEAELEALMESQPAAPGPLPPPPASQTAQGGLEAELEALMESQPPGPHGPRGGQPEAPSPQGSLEAELEAMMDPPTTQGSAGPRLLELDLEKLLDEDGVATQPGIPEAAGA